MQQIFLQVITAFLLIQLSIAGRFETRKAKTLVGNFPFGAHHGDHGDHGEHHGEHHEHHHEAHTGTDF